MLVHLILLLGDLTTVGNLDTGKGRMPRHAQCPLESGGYGTAAATDVDGLTKSGRERDAPFLVDAVHMNVIEDRTTRRHRRNPVSKEESISGIALPSQTTKGATIPADAPRPIAPLKMYLGRPGLSKGFYTIPWVFMGEL